MIEGISAMKTKKHKYCNIYHSVKLNMKWACWMQEKQVKSDQENKHWDENWKLQREVLETFNGFGGWHSVYTEFHLRLYGSLSLTSQWYFISITHDKEKHSGPQIE